MDWFTVDKQGLAKLLERRGRSFALFELIANAWDTNAKGVEIELTPVEGRPLVHVVVRDDDPDGFKNLAHAWTMFASSDKRSNADKRGRFNLGEKLVLALCEEAEIVSTTGGVRFDKDGRHALKRRTSAGSVFSGLMRMTRHELTLVTEGINILVPPEGVATRFNGVEMLRPKRFTSFVCILPTEVADAEGNLRPTKRQTTVNVYDADRNGCSQVFEMGVPVMLIDAPWSVEVMQKVPLSFERDAIKPAYLRDLMAFVVSAMHKHLKPEDAGYPIISQALESPYIDCDAASAIIRGQYGDKVAVFDPSDQEANKRLVAEGYNLIPGNAFSKEAWKNIRDTAVVQPAGKVSPSYKAYGDGPAAKMIPVSDWSPAMRLVAKYASELGKHLLDRSIDVAFEKGRMTSPWAANYGGHVLTFNYDRLGRFFFDEGVTERLNDLLLHEFAHEFGDHLSEEFDHTISRLGAKLWRLAMDRPEFFKRQTSSIPQDPDGSR